MCAHCKKKLYHYLDTNKDKYTVYYLLSSIENLFHILLPWSLDPFIISCAIPTPRGAADVLLDPFTLSRRPTQFCYYFPWVNHLDLSEVKHINLKWLVRWHNIQTQAGYEFSHC